MANNISGVSNYQQVNQFWNNHKAKEQSSTVSSDRANIKQDDKLSNEKAKADSSKSDISNVKISEWKPFTSDSSLIPTQKEGYGVVIGNVELSDKAKDYYDKLKSKFHGMDFILVSKDMKSQVASKASSYGNSLKPVVLIDEEKLERMATDEEYRKKYEGIIENSQAKLLNIKNSLTSSGASVKNFGMSVSEDGRTSFFATIEKSNKELNKAQEKRIAEKKEAKAKEKKAKEKEAREERIEDAKEKRESKTKEIEEKVAKAVEEGKESETESADISDIDSGVDEAAFDIFGEDEKEYIEFSSDSLDDLFNMISGYAYDYASNNVMTEAESKVGQNIDFRG